MTIYETPGVYIEEITGPGVIQGVGTSVAAFIGPTARGPADLPTRITNFDRFVATFGSTGPSAPHLIQDGRFYHLSFAVQGFFQNGGQQAYIVRVDNSTPGSLDLANAAGTVVARLVAKDPAVTPTVSIVDLESGTLAVAAPTATINPAPPGPSPIPGTATFDVLVDDASGFRDGDAVADSAATALSVDKILGNWLRLSGAAAAGALTIAPLDAASTSFRLTDHAGAVRVGSRLTVSNGADQLTCTVDSVTDDRVTVTVDAGATPVALAGTDPTATLASLSFASATANVTAAPAPGELVLDDVSGFRPGDVVTDGITTATVTEVVTASSTVRLDADLPGAATVTIADLAPERRTVRLTDIGGLRPGALLRLSDDTNETFAVAASVASSGVVTLADVPARAATIAAAAGRARIMELAVEIEGGTSPEVFTGLSANPTSSSWWVAAIGSTGSAVATLSEADPPPLLPLEQLVPVAIDHQPLVGAVVGNLADLGPADYQQALDTLQRIDDVNLVCAPDAATQAPDRRRTIQSAMITHCLQQGDRIALIDPPSGLEPSGPGSIEEIRGDVQSERGFAALYYPWLMILDPTRVPPQNPRRMAIPPSGHIAGVMARTDAERGVFKAPANTPVRNVLGVERQLTDREQAPLNRGGTNVLRVLPGNNAVTVWGARTTVDPAVTDWLYVNVRRLLLFIEESIQEGIRWAVFEPNDLGLWKALERVIRAFLRTQWQAGALFGATEDQAFTVRIDEGLNPPSVRNVGRLNIEIRVAPVRPAEFIVVRIGLFDGGAEIEEA